MKWNDIVETIVGVFSQSFQELRTLICGIMPTKRSVNFRRRKMTGFINYFLFFLLAWISAIAIRVYFDDRGE